MLAAMRVLTPWKVPAASPPKSTALMASAPAFFINVFRLLFFLFPFFLLFSKSSGNMEDSLLLSALKKNSLLSNVFFLIINNAS